MEQIEQNNIGLSGIIPLVTKHDLDEIDQLELDRKSTESVDRDEMEKLYASSMRNFKEGEIISGKVVCILSDHVSVDVGFKSEGMVPLSEFPHNGKELKVGEEIEVLLEKTENNDGEMVLSKEKANKIKTWNDITASYENGTSIEGVVISRIKGGLSVDVGLKGFLPGSQVDLRPVQNLDRLVGQKLKLKILKMNRKRGNIVLSRKVILEEERASSRQNLLATIDEGKTISGVVKNITEYGAFIDLGGVDGLLHITDMSWGRISHPSELFAVGDAINVVVLKYDPQNERVSLGYKQITTDPWSNVNTKYPIDEKVRGKVVSITDYGAFIELEQGIEGLVHITEMSWNKYLKHPSKLVAIGDMVDATVLSLDKDTKKIALSMKKLETDPWENVEEKYPIGSTVEGKIRTITDYGAFMELEDGIDGLIYLSDFSWTNKIKHPSEILKKREWTKAVVLNIDKANEKISLGLKQLTPDPWEKVGEKYHVGLVVSGKIVKITNFGVFVKIEESEGIEGLIHVSQLSSKKILNPKAYVKIDEQVSAKIIKIDIPNRKMALGIKAYNENIDVTEDSHS